MERARCRVIANILGNGFGKSLGPGSEVDLDEALGRNAAGGVIRLRDVVDLSWFEPLEAPAEEPNIEEDEE